MRLSSHGVERAMRLSVWDGRLFALGVGFGETYFLADAVRLGSSSTQIGLVVGLPVCAGALGAFAALQVLRRLRRRRPLVAGAAAAQALTLLSVAVAEAGGALTPTRLIALICLYQTFGQAAGSAWSSWFGDLVPADVRGRYFALRQRWVHLSSCAGLLAAGAALYVLEPAVGEASGGAGFATIFAIAAALRGASAMLLAITPEPPFRGVSGRERLTRFFATDRGRGVVRLLALGGALQFAVYVGAPYFTPFLLRELKFSYLAYTLATVTMVTMKFGMLPAWGRAVDAHGARSVYAAATFLVALITVPWMLADGLLWILVAQSISGFSWGGHEISSLTLMLESSDRRTRAPLFALQSAVNGAALLAGSLGGAMLVGLAGTDYRLAFGASALGRLSVAVVAARVLPRSRDRLDTGRREVLLRVIGFRPDGGLRQRPVDASEDEETFR